MTRSVVSRSLCVVMFAAGAFADLVEGETLKNAPWALPEGWRSPQSPSQVRVPDVPGPIRFTEPEFPPGAVVNGLTITTLNGIPIGATTTFGFTVNGLPSTDARISGGPPPQMFVDPPGIEGDATGELTVNFGQDVDRVGFGWAMSCPQSPPPSVTVTLLDSVGGIVATTTVPGANTGFPFAEGQVFMDPVPLFRSMRVTFNGLGGVCSRFFLDNLGYPPLVTPVQGETFTVE